MAPASHHRRSADRVRRAAHVCMSVRTECDDAITSRVRALAPAREPYISRILLISLVCWAITSSAISSIWMLLPWAFTSVAIEIAPS